MVDQQVGVCGQPRHDARGVFVQPGIMSLQYMEGVVWACGGVDDGIPLGVSYDVQPAHGRREMCFKK